MQNKNSRQTICVRYLFGKSLWKTFWNVTHVWIKPITICCVCFIADVPNQSNFDKVQCNFSHECCSSLKMIMGFVNRWIWFRIQTSLKIGLFKIYRSINSLSPVLLSWGIGSFGIGLFKNLHSGSHPSFKFQTSKFSFGTVAMTYALCFHWHQYGKCIRS